MRNGIRNCCLVLFGLIGFQTANAQNVEIFLCINNGQFGDPSNSASDADCIDVLGWSWGGEFGGQFSDPTQTSFDDLSLTKWTDNSSNYLMSKVTNAAISSLPNFQLRVREGCGVPECVGPLLYQLTAPAGSIVSSVATGSSGLADRMTENVTFNMPSSEWCTAVLDDNDDPTGPLTCGDNVLPSPP